MSHQHVRVCRAWGICWIALAGTGLLMQPVGAVSRRSADVLDERGGPEMVMIPPGTFLMGSASSEAGRYADEGPVHSVTINYAFEVSRYPVTRGDWRRYTVDTGNPGSGGCYGYSSSMAHDEGNPSTHAASAAQLLRTLQADRQHLRELLKTLGPRHPDMIQLQTQIDALGHSLEEEKLRESDRTLGRVSVDPVMIQLRARLVARQEGLAKLLLTEGPRHPDVIRMQAQIDATHSSIEAEEARTRRIATLDGSLPRSVDELALEQLRLALYAAQADMAALLKTHGQESPEAQQQRRKIAAAQASVSAKEAAIQRQHLQYSWSTPGFPQQDNQPVVCVKWEDAQDYTAWLSKKTGAHYRLLSEAEYEYVARAGSAKAYPWGPVSGDAQCKHVNGADDTLHAAAGPRGQVYASCSDSFTFTSPVDYFPPNALGLHDASGNVWSWVLDCYEPSYKGAPADGGARNAGQGCSTHVVRGGAWDSPPYRLRSAARDGARGAYFNVGFRIARTPKSEQP